MLIEDRLPPLAELSDTQLADAFVRSQRKEADFAEWLKQVREHEVAMLPEKWKELTTRLEEAAMAEQAYRVVIVEEVKRRAYAAFMGSVEDRTGRNGRRR